MLELRCDPADVDGLRREIARRDKIIGALMRQVEHGLNALDTDFALLQNTFVLEEQVRARTDELKKTVEALEAFMANASVGILFTRDRTMLRHNRKFGELFGFTGDDAIGKAARILYRCDAEYAEVGRLATPLLSAGQPFHTETPMRRRDGSDLWINLIGYVSPDEPAQGTIWILEDRTTIKHADQALRQSHSELEERVAERTSALSQQLHFLQQLIEAIPGPVFYKDAQSRYLGCNSAFEAFIGLPAAELIGKKPHDVAPAELADRHLASDQALLDQPGSQIYECLVPYPNGELRDVMFHKATFTRPDGSVGGMVGLMVDITERTRMEGNLQQATAVFENCAEGVIITTGDGAIIAVNRAFTLITGYQESEVIGRNPRLLQSGRHDRNFYHDMWQRICGDGSWQGEIWNRRKNGEIYPTSISIAAVHDKRGRLCNYVATFADITERKQHEEKIALLAFSDPLTNLPNRRLLLERLQQALIAGARTKAHGALFFIDLDDFKDVNDTLGHDTGDLLLQQVALRLADCVRQGDTVARPGGDEFVVMFKDLSEDAAKAVTQARLAGEHMLATLHAPYMLNGNLHHSTASIGITLFNGRHDCVDDLLKQADLAMYQAKGAGRNALRFFDPAMQTVVAARVAMEASLRQALRDQQFVLHYQPQVDHTGRITGAEALVRWNHPQRGIVSPNEFIPLAEETGLILPLGLWVLEQACAQLGAWAREPETARLTLAVNISARQFRQPEFVGQVAAALGATGADPRRLKLELTETLLVNDVEDIIAKMSLLKARGVGLALDDFGTGYSSLSYLKRLPLDQLKIDQSFIRGILVDSNDAAIAKMIIVLADSLGLAVIAEGVELAAQRDLLAGHGCLAYQGYLFSRPLPLARFEQLAKQLFVPAGGV